MVEQGLSIYILQMIRILHAAALTCTLGILLQRRSVDAFQVIFDGFGCKKTREPVEIIPQHRTRYRLRSADPVSGVLTGITTPTDSSPEGDMVREFWVDQFLDHFDLTDLRTWRQRVLANGELWRVGGPIIIYIGGEWEVRPTTLQGGIFYDIARLYNGMLFYPEHRFYGKSRPTPNASTRNLRYLRSDQALEDLAYFIQFIKGDVPELRDSRVIVFGGSYSGNLAAWFRLKYPHLCHGAVASSAPILAKADFWEFYETVGDSLSALGGRQCVDTIKAAMKQLRLQLTTAKGATKVQKLFDLCTPISYENPLDVATLMIGISAGFSLAVLHHGTSGSDIRRECQILGNATLLSNTALDALAIHFRTRAHSSNCVKAGYDHFISSLAEVNWGSSSTNGNMRQWFYQLCTEGGYSQTYTSQNQPFGVGDNTLRYSVRVCADLFGGPLTTRAATIMNRAVRHTNNINGGRNPNVTRVIFTNGSLDPWKRLGRLTDLNDESPAIVIDGYSHTQDLNSISPYDAPAMRRAKKRVQQIVGQWILE